jgi:hypothetical protein
MVFFGARKPLRPDEVRERLESSGWDVEWQPTFVDDPDRLEGWFVAAAPEEAKTSLRLVLEHLDQVDRDDLLDIYGDVLDASDRGLIATVDSVYRVELAPPSDPRWITAFGELVAWLARRENGIVLSGGRRIDPGAA